jgi:hypothetical protein
MKSSKKFLRVQAFTNCLNFELERTQNVPLGIAT